MSPSVVDLPPGLDTPPKGGQEPSRGHAAGKREALPGRRGAHA